MNSYFCELGSRTLLTFQNDRKFLQSGQAHIYTIQEEQTIHTGRGTLHQWNEYGGVKIVLSPIDPIYCRVEIINPALNYSQSSHPLRDKYHQRYRFAPGTAYPRYGVLSQGVINFREGEFNFQTDKGIKQFINNCIEHQTDDLGQIVPPQKHAEYPLLGSLEERAEWALNAYDLDQVFQSQSFFPQLEGIFFNNQYQHIVAQIPFSME